MRKFWDWNQLNERVNNSYHHAKHECINESRKWIVIFTNKRRTVEQHHTVQSDFQWKCKSEWMKLPTCRIWNEFSFCMVFMKRVVCFCTPEPKLNQNSWHLFLSNKLPMMSLIDLVYWLLYATVVNISVINVTAYRCAVWRRLAHRWAPTP